MMETRPVPPEGARNFVLLILDSCRYDAFMAASPRIMGALGTIERRYSYASWTSPSHFNLLMGLLPHASPTNVFASTYYKQELAGLAHRLGIPAMGFVDMVPRLWLPHFLRSTLGYRTQAVVSMPVLNGHTPLNVDFDSWELAPAHNDLAAIIPLLAFSDERPTFCLINTGETHYPYATPDEPESEWPVIHGVHGVFKRAGGGSMLTEAEAGFDRDRLAALQQRQVHTVSWVDRSVEQLIDALPPNTWLTVTADHGELFGEGGYFGHGPILHDKVMEVPFVEGLVNATA
jgi:hypothetical protein